MIAAVIAACEIGFWVVLGLGLTLRYPGGRPRAGAVVLACAPLADVVLLAVTAIDLHRGADFRPAHALAAGYLGFSIAFGHRLMSWADVRFAHRFAGGPAPEPKAAKGSRARCSDLWSEWWRVVLAVVIASGVLGALTMVAAADQRAAVLGPLGGYWLLVGLWLVLGPLWEESVARTRSPTRPTQGSAQSPRA